MEQRIEDLIERLKSFDGATRIEGYVNLKWNDKRTAVVATEDKLLETLKERDASVKYLKSHIANLEDKDQ